MLLSQAMALLTRSPCPILMGAGQPTRFVDPTDLRHDMHVNIVTFQPGRHDPFCRNTCHGTRAFRSKRQGGLSFESRLGSRSKRVTICGFALFARKPVMLGGQTRSAICSIRM
jgi:hypothetical protein